MPTSPGRGRAAPQVQTPLWPQIPFRQVPRLLTPVGSPSASWSLPGPQLQPCHPSSLFLLWMCFLSFQAGLQTCPLPFPSPTPLFLLCWVPGSCRFYQCRPLGPLTPSPPLSSHCSCLRSSGWVEQWLGTQPLGLSRASIPRLPLTGWWPGANSLTSPGFSPATFAGGWQVKNEIVYGKQLAQRRPRGAQSFAACWEEAGHPPGAPSCRHCSPPAPLGLPLPGSWGSF